MKRLIVVGTVALCAAAFAGEFKAGFSRVDITPPLGVYMPGYYQARHAKEILDPLQINCVAFSDGTRIVTNYSSEPFVCRGKTVKPMSYEVFWNEETKPQN